MSASHAIPIRVQVAIAALSVFSYQLSAFCDTIERRGAEGTVEGDVVALNDSGVVLRSASGAEHEIPWDRVRDVSMARRDQRLAEHMAVAEDLWRARSRVERQDRALAEPLFERLHARFEGRTHETALVVAEGLLRCRLARGDQAAALPLALEVARLRRAGVRTDSYTMLTPVVDETLQLSPLLPPAWLPSRGLGKLQHELAGFDDRGDPVVGAMAGWYLRSVVAARGGDPGAIEVAPADHPGVALLRALVESGAADGETRRRVREQIDREHEGLPAWGEAWVRYFVGVSLLRERGAGQRQEGLVALAHLPARYGATQRYLSGLALAHMIGALEALGDPGGAATLRAELGRAHPAHPVLETLPAFTPPAEDTP